MPGDAKHRKGREKEGGRTPAKKKKKNRNIMEIDFPDTYTDDIGGGSLSRARGENELNTEKMICSIDACNKNVSPP